MSDEPVIVHITLYAGHSATGGVRRFENITADNTRDAITLVQEIGEAINGIRQDRADQQADAHRG